MRKLLELSPGTMRILAVLYMAGLTWLSSRPGTGGSLPFPGADKLVHFTLYFPLGLLLIRSVSTPVAGVVCGVLFAAMDEWHQSFVPGRTPSLADGLADAAGLLMAWWVLRRQEEA